MLELLLKIIDKLKELLELRDQRAENIFEKFIEPIYKDMELVHKDYLEMLHQLTVLLPDADSKPEAVKEACQKALDVLRPRSQKLEAARDTLRASIHSLHKKRTTLREDVRNFIDVLLRYYPELLLLEHSTKGKASRYFSWKQHLQRVIQSPFDKNCMYLRNDAEEMLIETKESWIRITEVFTEIKLSVVSK